MSSDFLDALPSFDSSLNQLLDVTPMDQWEHVWIPLEEYVAEYKNTTTSEAWEQAMNTLHQAKNYYQQAISLKRRGEDYMQMYAQFKERMFIAMQLLKVFVGAIHLMVAMRTFLC